MGSSAAAPFGYDNHFSDINSSNFQPHNFAQNFEDDLCAGWLTTSDQHNNFAQDYEDDIFAGWLTTSTTLTRLFPFHENDEMVDSADIFPLQDGNLG